MANSNERITHLTGAYLRQCTWDASFSAMYWSHLHPVIREKGRKKRERERRKWLSLGGARVGRKERRREPKKDPSLKGTVLASQPSHHFNALSCGDVSLCMVLRRPLFSVSSMFLAPSQLNAHWNSREEMPHWALHYIEWGADERTCLF